MGRRDVCLRLPRHRQGTGRSFRTLLRARGLCSHPGSQPWLCLPSPGLSFPPAPSDRGPAPRFCASVGSARIGADGGRGSWRVRPGPEGCLLPLPQRGGLGPRCSPTPQLPGARVLCLSRSSSPPSPASQRLRNHLSLDPRGRAEEGQASPAPTSCPWPSLQPLSSRLPGVPGCPPTPFLGAAVPFVRKGEGKDPS